MNRFLVLSVMVAAAMAAGPHPDAGATQPYDGLGGMYIIFSFSYRLVCVSPTNLQVVIHW